MRLNGQRCLGSLGVGLLKKSNPRPNHKYVYVSVMQQIMHPEIDTFVILTKVNKVVSFFLSHTDKSFPLSSLTIRSGEFKL